jgi:hypothetical protein
VNSEFSPARFPGPGLAVLMEQCDDRDAIRLVYEVDGIRKLMKQSAAHVFFDNRKVNRIIRNVFE